jgi:hypothetical protein
VYRSRRAVGRTSVADQAAANMIGDREGTALELRYLVLFDHIRHRWFDTGLRHFARALNIKRIDHEPPKLGQTKTRPDR